MITKIKTTVYAKKLRDKLKELEPKHVKDLAQYKVAFARWKTTLAAWIHQNAKQNVTDITMQEVKDSSGYRSNVHFDASKFFAGCPDAPKYPSNKQIRDIKALLRHLGITGQETVTVSTEDIARHLGDGEKYEE